MNLSSNQRSILLALLDTKRRTGSPTAAMDLLVRILGMPREYIERECECLVQVHYAVCTPTPGPAEIVSLTLTGVRAARRLLEPPPP